VNPFLNFFIGSNEFLNARIISCFARYSGIMVSENGILENRNTPDIGNGIFLKINEFINETPFVALRLVLKLH